MDQRPGRQGAGRHHPADCRVEQRCAFERTQQLGEAGQAGWTAAEIATIKGAGLFGRLGASAAVLDFAGACMAAPQVPGSVLAAARVTLSDRGLAMVIVLVGHYTP